MNVYELRWNGIIECLYLHIHASCQMAVAVGKEKINNDEAPEARTITNKIFFKIKDRK